MRTVARTLMMLVIGAAASDLAAQENEAALTLVGEGDKPVQVRGADGDLTETIGQSQLRLNTIPADIAQREADIRQRRQERAQAIAERRRQMDEEDAARAAAEAGTPAQGEDTPDAEAQESKPEPPPARNSTNRGTRFYAKEPVDPQLRKPENTGVTQVWPPPRPKTP